MIKMDEIPVYAGLITFPKDNVYDMTTKKRAKRIHANPIETGKLSLLASKLMWRCWSARQKIHDLQSELEYRVKQTVNN